MVDANAPLRRAIVLGCRYARRLGGMHRRGQSPGATHVVRRRTTRGSRATPRGGVDARTSDGSILPPVDAAGIDATMSRDGGTGGLDAGRDATSGDATSDARVDSGIDAGRDVGVDAPFDAGSDGPPRTLVTVRCATSTTNGAGIAADTSFYTGWRFQVGTGGLDVTALGARYGYAVDTTFVAIVALTSSADFPNSPTLTSTDVVATAILPATTTGSTSVEASFHLPAGWYAEIFGAGRFGASSGGSSLPYGDTTPCSNGLPPITIRQSDGMNIQQSGSIDAYVKGFAVLSL
ncbi:MAG: hypothetical protein U0169_10110 [Polyangiaceae bacterium]